MADEQPPTQRKRKSVSFTDQALAIDTDGTVTMASTEPIDETTQTAVSHSLAPVEAPVEAPAAADDGLDLSLLKKKKKKSSKKKEGDEGEEAPAAGGDDELDPTLKKKKKKKAAKERAAGDDEFAEKLKQLELRDEEPAAEVVEDGDMDKGTGIWAHDCSTAIPYSMLLRRFYHTLEQKNPDHATSGSRSYKIPPPQCMREGNKKTIFANIADVAKRMKRTDEHITMYLFAELGTTGSVDGARRLVIRGRFQQQHIENVLRKYIIEYVVCKTCKSPDTELNKGENRLYFITCNSCGSRRSVTAIKTGFSAQVGKRRKQQA